MFLVLFSTLVWLLSFAAIFCLLSGVQKKIEASVEIADVAAPLLTCNLDPKTKLGSVNLCLSINLLNCAASWDLFHFIKTMSSSELGNGFNRDLFNVNK